MTSPTGEIVTGNSTVRRHKVDPQTSILSDSHHSVERVPLTVNASEDPVNKKELFESSDGENIIFFTPPSSPTLSHSLRVSFLEQICKKKFIKHPLITQ